MFWSKKFENLQHAALATSIGSGDKVDSLVWLPGELRVAHEVLNVHLREDEETSNDEKRKR